MYVNREVVKVISKYDKIYEYKDERGNKISNKKTLEYIKSLKIPPAYENVKINLDKDAKLLVTGYDVKGKKQYIYNQLWIEMRTIKKFCNMIDFGIKLPNIENDINKLLNLKTFTKEKHIAIILKLIMTCHFRIGNPIGKDVYNSYGVSTLNKSHLKESNNMTKLTIDFRGKKGVQNKCVVKNKELIKTIYELKNRANNKNEQIFFYMENRKKKIINSCDVNNFLKTYGDFTTKDFRTWYANIYFIDEIMKFKQISNKITDRKKNTRNVIKIIAEKLHHTVAICKKKYINPNLIDLYIDTPKKFNQLIAKNYKGNKPASNAFIYYMRDLCKNIISKNIKNNINLT